MQVSFWNNQIFIKMTLKFKFENVQKFTFKAVFEFPSKFITGVSAAI